MGTPGVSHNEVVCAVGASVANGHNGVIQTGATMSAVHDATGVESEEGSFSFDGNACWLLVNGSLQLVDGLGGHNGIGVNLDLLLVGDGLALWEVLIGCVGIVALELKGGALGIVEGPNLKSTIATLVALSS